MRYIRNLAIFTLISEIPYRLYGGLDFTQINIMFTLLLGYILVYAFGRPLRSTYMEPSFITFIVVLVVMLLDLTSYFKVQYGLGGVLLPLAIYLVLKNLKPSYFIFMIGCAVVMNVNLYEGQLFNSLSIFLMNLFPVLMSVVGVLLPFGLINTNIKIHIPPVKKWAYWFYPIHFLVLFSLRYIYRILT